MRPRTFLIPASKGRTFYEAPAWGPLSTEYIEGMRGRIDAAGPDIARTAKIRSIAAGLVIEIPGLATDEQIARLRQWLHSEAALLEGRLNLPTERDE